MHYKNYISAVVCTKNSETNIRKCLHSLKNIKRIDEIILVDAKSKDNTINIAKEYCNKILYDNGKGLGAARNLGVSNTKGEYILNIGNDNIIDEDTIKIMIDTLIINKATAVGCITKVNGNSYFSKAMNLYKKSRFFPGKRNVIGTPTLFDGKILRENNFSINEAYSDDAEICERLIKKNMGVFFICDAYVIEDGTCNFKSVLSRWLSYGESDYKIYKNNHKKWSFLRRLYSIFYPLINELIKPLIKCSLREKVYILPFLILITLFRYFSWSKLIIKNLI